MLQTCLPVRLFNSHQTGVSCCFIPGDRRIRKRRGEKERKKERRRRFASCTKQQIIILQQLLPLPPPIVWPARTEAGLLHVVDTRSDLCYVYTMGRKKGNISGKAGKWAKNLGGRETMLCWYNEINIISRIHAIRAWMQEMSWSIVLIVLIADSDNIL